MTENAKEKKFVIPKKTGHEKEAHEMADFVMREDDRVTRWKKVHDLLREKNETARKEQDLVAKECAEFRAEKLIRKTKTKTMGLRWGVAMPPMTWRALVAADRLAFGKSDLGEPDKEDYSDLAGSNSIVKDLEKAFPQYRVS